MAGFTNLLRFAQTAKMPHVSLYQRNRFGMTL